MIPIGVKKAKVVPLFGKETDVLIVGTGFAGLCAANRAIDLRARVTVIEKLPESYWAPGGSLVVSGHFLRVSGRSLMQPEEKLAALIERDTAKRAPAEMVRAFVGNAHRAIEWLKGCGVEFVEPAGKEYCLKPAKEPVVNNRQWGLVKPGGKYDAKGYGGKVQSQVLLSRLKKLGATIAFETPAKRLLMNDKGAVVGAVVKTKDGEVEVNAKTVILCTGGMHHNQEMMVRYCGPHASEVLPYGSPGATGDGHEMALEIGAALRHPGVVGGLRACPEDCVWNMDHYYNNLEFLAFHGILVDEYGERVFDESMSVEQKIALQHMVKHTESVTGMILVDHALYRQHETVRNIIDRVLEFNGTVYKAETIEEISTKALKDEKLGLRLGRQQNLVSTVRTYNKAVEEGKYMELRPSRKANLNKIATPPIYAVPFTPVAISSKGGLLVNDKAEVVSRFGGQIPGLYAVGELMHNSIGGGPNNTLGHDTALGVSPLAICLVFGVISAENAASFAKRVVMHR